MKIWIIAAVMIGLVLIAGLVAANLTAINDTNDASAQSCGQSCGNSCTAENNCGLKTCGAINDGLCSCGK